MCQKLYSKLSLGFLLAPNHSCQHENVLYSQRGSGLFPVHGFQGVMGIQGEARAF